MQRMLVAGGAGFVGSHLCDLLLREGYRVTAVDNLVTGSTDNVAHILHDPNFTFIKHDITQPLNTDERYDGIFNFASPASPEDYLQMPVETLKVGSIGTLNLLSIARLHEAVFLQASTSEVYGDPMVHPQVEEYWGNVNPVGPRSVYDESKRFAEALVMAYQRTYGVSTRIVRIFNTYGPRMKLSDGRVVPNLIYQALTGRPMTVYGDGRQTRSFCYVKDEIEGIYRLFKSDYAEPMNIGNPHELTVLEFAHTIRRLTGTESEIVFKPLPVDDPLKRQPDITKAKRILGWEPVVSLEQGLEETIAYFASRIPSSGSAVMSAEK